MKYAVFLRSELVTSFSRIVYWFVHNYTVRIETPPK